MSGCLSYPTLWPATEDGWYRVDSWRNVSSPRPWYTGQHAYTQVSSDKTAYQTRMMRGISLAVSCRVCQKEQRPAISPLLRSSCTNEHRYTYHHATDADDSTAYETASVTYPPLEQVRPSELCYERRKYVAKRNDALGCGGRYEVESGR